MKSAKFPKYEKETCDHNYLDNYQQLYFSSPLHFCGMNTLKQVLSNVFLFVCNISYMLNILNTKKTNIESNLVDIVNFFE